MDGTENSDDLPVEHLARALGSHPFGLPVRANDGEFEVIRRAGVDCGLNRSGNRRARLRRKKVDTFFEWRRMGRLDPGDTKNFPRPGELHGLQIDFPPPYLGHRPRTFQHLAKPP